MPDYNVVLLFIFRDSQNLLNAYSNGLGEVPQQNQGHLGTFRTKPHENSGTYGSQVPGNSAQGHWVYQDALGQIVQGHPGSLQANPAVPHPGYQQVTVHCRFDN